MTDADLEAEFFLGWTALPVETPSSNGSTTGPGKRASRLAGETEERRERRLRQARECSARRRSMETEEQREKRLVEQRERMAQKRHQETMETREKRRVLPATPLCGCGQRETIRCGCGQ